MYSEAAEQSAWVHFFNQAVSDLTKVVDHADKAAGLPVRTPPDPKVLMGIADGIADAAIEKLVSKGIPEEYWPTAPR